MSDKISNDKPQATASKLERLVMSLKGLARYDVGDYDEGDGYMCSYADQSEDGTWIRVEDIGDILKEFGA